MAANATLDFVWQIGCRVRFKPDGIGLVPFVCEWGESVNLAGVIEFNYVDDLHTPWRVETRTRPHSGQWARNPLNVVIYPVWCKLDLNFPKNASILEMRGFWKRIGTHSQDCFRYRSCCEASGIILQMQSAKSWLDRPVLAVNELNITPAYSLIKNWGHELFIFWSFEVGMWADKLRFGVTFRANWRSPSSFKLDEVLGIKCDVKGHRRTQLLRP